MSKTLHLMTQRGQPMGSERRCCENCGLMMVGRDAAFWREHSWTDEPANYKDGPAEGEDFTTCDTVRSKPAAYSDVVSDGGMDPRNAADARAAKPQPAPGFVLVPTIPGKPCSSTAMRSIMSNCVERRRPWLVSRDSS